MSQIQPVLTNLFKKHRIVFWYDTKRELRAEFEALVLPEVETIELDNNEFAVKYRILREQPNQKFLLYHEGPESDYLENWLLDVQLAEGVFQADQISLWLNELELSPNFMEVIQAHAEFFTSEKRRMALKDLRKDDTPSTLRLKMLSICAESEPRLDEILESLLTELSEEQESRLKLIRRCGLDAFLWELLARNFGYKSDAPGVEDFAIELFKSCFALELGQLAKLSNDALVFLNRLKDSHSYPDTFERLSTKYAGVLGIEGALDQQDYRCLVDMDLFRLIDLKILSELARGVVERTLPASECAVTIRQRHGSHWYQEFKNLYEAMGCAAQFLKTLDEANLTMESLADGVQRYAATWYRLDQLYRSVVFHFRKSGQVDALKQVMETIENHYNNSYLLTLSNDWQRVVDAADCWQAEPVIFQRDFFERFVAPFLQNNKKVYVIISDALRYEVADELLSLVRREDRYEAELTPLLGMLPSYTQVGMAALLPNREIAFAENAPGYTTVDGLSTQGTDNRDTILKQIGAATAIRADDLLSLNRDECRALVRDNDVIYIYHNRIDSVGDKRETEERVFEAVAETLDELLTIIKKLTAANATNLLVTADHGFIYQNRVIESDFSGADVSSPSIIFQDRRFVLGKDLADQPGLKKFHSVDVGLVGDMDIQLPKSIQRLRKKGSGSRYVHGGAALQEVVVPVVKINKKRESDLSQVEVDIIRGAGALITSGQLSVTFYQVQAVSDKVQGRKLRAGIYTQSGTLISDQHALNFDLEAENPRERETAVRFILTREANQANNQEITLRLEEQVAVTSHYQEYKTLRYTLRRSFTSDFDF